VGGVFGWREAEATSKLGPDDRKFCDKKYGHGVGIHGGCMAFDVHPEVGDRSDAVLRG